MPADVTVQCLCRTSVAFLNEVAQTAASGSSQSAIMLPTQVHYSCGGVLRIVLSASHPAVIAPATSPCACCCAGVINLVHMMNVIKQHHPQVSFADTFQLASALSIEVRLLSHLSALQAAVHRLC